VEKYCADTSERVRENYHKDVDKSQDDTSERVREHYRKDVANSGSQSKSTSKHYLVNIDELCK